MGHFLGSMAHLFLQPPVHGAEKRSTEEGCKEFNRHFKEQWDRIRLCLGFHELNDRLRADFADAFNDPA